MPRAHTPSCRPRIEPLEERALLADARPNILLLLTDDQRADTIAYMPTVSSLLDRATEFRSAVVTTSVCCPSRASIFTGQYASTHGVTNNERADEFPEDRSVAVELQKANYYTAFIGKYLNEFAGHTPPGWDQFAGLLQGRYHDPILWEYRDGVELGAVEHPGTYSTDLYSRRARRLLSELEENDKEPWFIEVAFSAPHGPPTPAPRHEDLEIDPPPPAPSVPEGEYDADFVVQQLRTLRAVDDAVRNILDRLEKLDELEDTLIVYTSDNGFLWGEHGLHGKAVPHEEAHRVPLIVLAGWDLTAAKVDSVVANIDLAPTFLAYAQAPIPADMEGVSLRATIEAKQDKIARKFVYFEGPDIDEAEKDRIGYRGLRRKRWVFIHYRDGSEELYDLKNDPYQMTNLAETAERAEQVLRLRNLVLARTQI